MNRAAAAFACIAALTGATQTAHAQVKPPTTLQPPPGMGAPGAAPVPAEREAAPRGEAPAGDRQNLSTRLSETNGTLHPPPVDQGMQRTPTQPGTMPVIPPPGTPGGAPGAVAK